MWVFSLSRKSINLAIIHEVAPARHSSDHIPRLRRNLSRSLLVTQPKQWEVGDTGTTEDGNGSGISRLREGTNDPLYTVALSSTVCTLEIAHVCTFYLFAQMKQEMGSEERSPRREKVSQKTGRVLKPFCPATSYMLLVSPG